MSLYRTLIILLFIAIVPLYSQKQPPIPPIKLDSYFERIKKLVDDESFPSLENLLQKRAQSKGQERVDVCLDLFTHYIFKSTRTAKKYNDEAYELSRDLGYDGGYLRSSLNQAFVFFVRGEFDLAMDIIDRVETNDKCELYSDIEADGETLKSYIFTERCEYDLAYETALNLLETGEAQKNPYCMIMSYSAISHFYLRLVEYD